MRNSSKRNAAESVTREPLETYDIAALLISLRRFIAQRDDRPAEAVLLFGRGHDGQAQPVSRLADAAPEHSAILTIAHDINALPESPIQPERVFPLPDHLRPFLAEPEHTNALPAELTAAAFYRAVRPPAGIGPCMRVELGPQTATATVRTLGDTLRDIAKARTPDSFITVSDYSHNFLRTYLPELVHGADAAKTFGFHKVVSGTRDGRAYEDIRTSPGFQGDEDRVTMTFADNDKRSAREYFLEKSS